MKEQNLCQNNTPSPEPSPRADGGDRAGITVQVFDRDMPSVERRQEELRQNTPALPLAVATTDADGSFRITYTLEQFSSGEGITLFRRGQGQNADLSFLVLNGTGQKLKITRIVAQDREYRPNQIIV